MSFFTRALFVILLALFFNYIDVYHNVLKPLFKAIFV